MDPLDKTATEATFQRLTERQRAVLSSIVHRYIGGGEPVGSRILSKDLVESISPATIRNVMSDIEDMGLIEQPHTSAGRQPTELGFRAWVNHLMPRESMTEQECGRIDQALREARDERELLMGVTLALAEVTRLLGVAVAPVKNRTRLDRLDLIPVGEMQMVLVATFGSGLVRSLSIDFDAPVHSDTLAELAREVHVAALGNSLEEIQQKLRGSWQGSLSELACRILEALLKISESGGREDVVLQGAAQMLAQPELGDRAHQTDLVQLLEDRRLLAQMLQERAGQDDVVITIGSQHGISQMRFLSLVSRGYRMGDSVGSIGVLGPTRMPYGKLVSVVDYLAQRLSQG